MDRSNLPYSLPKTRSLFTSLFVTDADSATLGQGLVDPNENWQRQLWPHKGFAIIILSQSSQGCPCNVAATDWGEGAVPSQTARKLAEHVEWISFWKHETGALLPMREIWLILLAGFPEMFGRRS